jgi:hypothetical protein
MSSHRTRVYFTIDTETSMGGAWRNHANYPLGTERTIFGQLQSRTYGIPLIMDILEEHGFAGTFFIEVFCSDLLGRDAIAEVFRTVTVRGHDAQLHLHPVFRFYHRYLHGGEAREQDFLFQFSAEEQIALVREGVALFRDFTGRMPRAFRAGCYAASEVTLQALRKNGIAIDSSYNLSALDRTCGFRVRPLNAPQRVEGVYEFPVTNITTGFNSGYKNLEVSAVSVEEILGGIRRLRNEGCRDVVLVLHSFSLLKGRDVRFEHCRPDRIVIRRFRRLCAALSRLRDDIEVTTLGDVDLASVPLQQPQVVVSGGWMQPMVRKAVQGLNYIPWI